ncbi:hypothetical protein GcM3_207051, partial [Golovinomyces cichoracearum]
YRSHSRASQRSALNTRQSHLKGLPFPKKYDQQINRLDELFDLAARGKAANNPTYTGYNIIEDLLFLVRNFDESLFHTHYDKMLCQETSDQLPNIKVVIDELKQKLAVHGTTLQHQSTISHSAFAILQGSSHEAKALKLSKNSKRQKRECPCGRGSTSGAALADFEPQLDIINHSKDLREARPGLDRALKDHKRRIKK